MLDLTKFHQNIVKTLCEASGKNEGYVSTLSPTEAFDLFLTYNGIIGFTYTIISVLDSFREAEVKQKGE